MNRLVLWLANVALFVAACVATVWVLGQTPAAASADAGGDAAKGLRGERRLERKGATRDAAYTRDRTGADPAADADVLWQRTLFRPERTENLDQPTVEDPAAAAATLNLELVGLARVGERAVAVIVQHRGAAPRRAVVPGAPGTGGRPGVPRPPAVPAAPARPAGSGEPEGPPDRHVYKIGDAVGSSGYTLKDIRLKEKEVVLVRGSEERVLKLETSDDQSSSRRETAAAQAVQPKPVEATQPATPKPDGDAAAVAAAAAAAGAPPPPPPPPPVPGAVGAPGAPPGAEVTPAAAVAGKEAAGAVSMTREERLERARLLRERILQGRSPGNTQ